MPRQKICPKCNKSVFTYVCVKKDPHNKKKEWKIESCSKCGFNFDIEEYHGR